MSMQMGAALIGGWLVESEPEPEPEPDHAAPRSARPDRDTDAGTEQRRARRTRGVQASDVVLIGSALFTGRWAA